MTCSHLNTWFDRTMCACDTMHTYCQDCGECVDDCVWQIVNRENIRTCLIDHYVSTIRLIESILVLRTPKFVKPKPLIDEEVRAMAEALATAHAIASR